MEVAKIGANVVLGYLRSLPETIEAIDVRSCEEYQAIDIDILWKRRHNQAIETVTISVKTDTYHWTGNIILETWSVKEQNKVGWMYYSKADFLYYYYAQLDLLYIIPFAALKPWFDANIQRYPEASPRTSEKGGYRTVFRKVRVDDLEKEVPGVVKLEKVAERLGLKELREPG